MAQVTMLTTMCGPNGNASPGTVLEISEKEAKALLEPAPATEIVRNEKGEASERPMYDHRPFARKFDRERDRNAKQHGLVRPEK